MRSSRAPWRALAASALVATASCAPDGRTVSPRPQCQVAADCPSTECEIATCTGGACGLAPAGAGTEAAQVPGNCRHEACDGAGNVTAAPDPSDLPAPVDCRTTGCDGGTPTSAPVAELTPCDEGGGTVCDGAGACVECVDGGQCAGGTCAGNACQLPSCDDGVANGVETDVDCGGTACAACAAGEACLVAADCATGACASHACAVPTVRIRPADGTINVTGTSFEIDVRGVPLASLDAAGAGCDGTVQLSYDGFSSCVGSLGPSGFQAVTSDGMSAGFGSFSIMGSLEPGATYGAKVTRDALTDGGTPCGFDTVASFTAAPDPQACQVPSPVVVSQVYWGGGASGAAFANDFVELHHRGEGTVVLDGWSVQLASISGTVWQVVPLDGAMAPGAYHLVQLAGGATGAALPQPDDASPAVDLPESGRVALVASAVALSGVCPADVAIRDVLVHGTLLPPSVCGEIPVRQPSGDTALARTGAGCLAFVPAPPSPRSSASPAALCPCASGPVNETDEPVEADSCRIEGPAAVSAPQGGTTELVYGRVYEAGLTEAAGAPARLVAQLGLGPAGSDPRSAVWIFRAAAYGAQAGSLDEYQATLAAPPAPGTYAYAFRFSLDGGVNWTYCDLDGAGSSSGLAFDPALLGVLTVGP